MGVYSKTLHHVNNKDFKKTRQRHLDEKNFLSLKIREKEILEQQEVEQIKEISSSLKSDWKSELFPEIKQEVKKEEVKVNVKVPEKLKSDWRKELSEGMSSKDFEYLYGISISDMQISSILGGQQKTDAQDIVNASTNTTDYQFGLQFPGSYVNSIGDNQINSQSKVDVLAFLDTSYGNVSGSNLSYSLTTGPEGLPPEGQSPPGSVVSRVNLESALGITLPSGVPNGNLGGTPIEGSAIKRIFTDARPGRRINFNWTFASSEDFLGAATVDDYAFVAIKGNVTKFVSVLTRGLQYGGQFVYTVQSEDIVDGKVEIGIGVIDVFDPYVQTALNISNFGSFWGAGTLGDTTDAADLGMSVAAGTPSSNTSNKKKKDEPTYQYGNEADFQRWVQSQQTPVGTQVQLPGGGTLTRVSDTGFKPGTTFTYDKVTDAGVQKVTTDLARQQLQNRLAALEKENLRLSQSRNPADWDKAQFGTAPEISRLRAELSKSTVTSTPPSKQQSQKQLTPQQLANIEKELKKLEADNEKIKADANRRNWELAANLAMDVVTAAALLSPIPGDEAAVIGARTAAQTAKMARSYQRQNPGKYNPFLSDKANQLARQQGVGTNVKGQNPAFRNPLKNSYEPQGQVISEKTVKTLKSVNQALYPGQPSPNGFPDQDPPKQLPNGFHQDYGKMDKMYNTLDKTSAMSMPPTGNPEIDKKVAKARKQPK
jgi:hypothetical protein